MSSPLLGSCDLVLAISQATINSQFLSLYKQFQINPEWQFLVLKGTGTSPNKLYTKDVSTAISSWQASGDHSYYYGINAMINAPRVAVVEGSPEVLEFQVSFVGGTFYYQALDSSTVLTASLSDVVYVFEVPLKQVVIEGLKQVVYEQARSNISDLISDSDLHKSQVAIGALLLDFSNANIDQFDPQKSKLPSAIAPYLSKAMSDYFKVVLPAQEKPYIVSYTFTAPGAAESTAALQPSSARFSTSYTGQQATNAVNFLFMTSGKSFPSAPTTGIIAESLIARTGTSAELSGAFGIDFGLFREVVVEPILNDLKQELVDTVSFGAPNFISPAKTSTVKNVAATGAILPQYEITAQLSGNIAMSNGHGPVGKPIIVGKGSYSVSAGISTGIKSVQGDDGSRALELTITTNYETSLTENTDGKKDITLVESTAKGKGVPGIFTIRIQAGAKGKLNMTMKEQQLILSSGTNVAQIGLAASVTKVFSKWQDDLQKQLSRTNTTSVILPFGTLYTFKNFQLAQTDSSSSGAGAVLSQIAYIPES